MNNNDSVYVAQPVSSTLSIVKTLNDISIKNIESTLPMTINKVLLYKAGSSLTPVNLGQLSY